MNCGYNREGLKNHNSGEQQAYIPADPHGSRSHRIHGIKAPKVHNLASIVHNLAAIPAYGADLYYLPATSKSTAPSWRPSIRVLYPHLFLCELMIDTVSADPSLARQVWKVDRAGTRTCHRTTAQGIQLQQLDKGICHGT